jgi:hypothetical protein
MLGLLNRPRAPGYRRTDLLKVYRNPSHVN